MDKRDDSKPQPDYCEETTELERHSSTVAASGISPVWLTVWLLVLLNHSVGAAMNKSQLAAIARAAVAPGGDTIGLQILVGRGDRIDFFECYGRRSPDGSEPVDRRTMFCIGSCSKPLSAVTIMRLVDVGKLKLDRMIDAWLPQFAHQRLAGGGSINRLPTMSDILCHRAGIYSQKQKISNRQKALLYTFKHDLAEAVDGIAKFPFISEPGTKFAYSGAGYCVAGRVAEVALDQQFDRIMQERLCEPIGMSRTTYFPGRIDDNIAVGAIRQGANLVPIEAAPHRNRPHRMQLIGGSLYSTAGDLAKFCRMILDQGGSEPFLSASSWHEMTKPRGSNKGHGLGWAVQRRGNEIIRLSHGGALTKYRANLTVHLPTNS